MSKFLRNIKQALKESSSSDRAEGLVPTLLIVAAFAVVAVLTVMWIGNAVVWQAHLQTRCITQQEGFETTNGNPGTKCIGLNNYMKGPEVLKNQINDTKGGRF